MKRLMTQSSRTRHILAVVAGLLLGSQLNDGWPEFKEGFAQAFAHQMESSR